MRVYVDWSIPFAIPPDLDKVETWGFTLFPENHAMHDRLGTAPWVPHDQGAGSADLFYGQEAILGEASTGDRRSLVPCSRAYHHYDRGCAITAQLQRDDQ